MPVKINGLPAHVLLIHVVIVMLPIAAAMLVASALWPTARRKLGFLSPAAALVALVLVPVTTNAGEWLQNHLSFTNAAIRKHAELGHTLLPWAIGVFVVSTAVWVLGRRFEMSLTPARAARSDSTESLGFHDSSVLTEPRTDKQTLPIWATGLLALAALAVSVGAMIQLYRIGDSGAHAVWGGVPLNGR